MICDLCGDKYDVDYMSDNCMNQLKCYNCGKSFFVCNGCWVKITWLSYCKICIRENKLNELGI